MLALYNLLNTSSTLIQSLRQREILFLDDVIECEREVKQVQTSWRLCVVSCHIFGLLVMVTAVFSSEKVNNNSYESKKIAKLVSLTRCFKAVK